LWEEGERRRKKEQRGPLADKMDEKRWWPSKNVKKKGKLLVTDSEKTRS